MVSIKQILADCFSLSGNISIRNEIIGFGTVSLLELIRLLKNNQHIRLHIKIITNTTTFTLDQMVDAFRQLYHSIGIGVIVRSVENLNLPASFMDIDVGNCQMGQTTNEQNQLFNNRNNVVGNDIVVYFVRSTVPAFNGCAAFPANRPGAIVVRTASQWTLAHEVGHVLGLPHVDASPNCLLDRLMTGCGTFNITNPPPDLIQSEVNTMNNSQLTVTC
jgi:hypothetical protein